MSDTAPAIAALPASRLGEATVLGGDGEPLGKVADVIIDVASGAIAYVVVAVGGVLGVGERLFALPWRCLVAVDLDTLHTAASAADLADRRGFDKDCWPTEADPWFDRFAGAQD